MADIDLVIKMDEEVYKRIKSLSKGDYFEHDICGNSMRRIANGTPLPKEHGDLKDMDDIYEALEGWSDDTGWIVDAIDFQTPTIIEAESEE